MRIDGRATPTTRLSSDTMKSAIDTIARVQPVRGEVVERGADDMRRSFRGVLCDRSLTRRAKKERSATVDGLRTEQDVRPVLVDVRRGLRGLRERVADAGVAAVVEREKELGLRREQAEEVRLRDACGLGDLERRRAVQAARGEDPLGCFEDRLATLVGGREGAGAGRGRAHGQV